MITVVIPALNEAAVLPATLDALQPLRREGHEVLLVDGGSRDATVAVAAPLVDRVLASPPGRARQLAAGATAAAGELLWFLHADTVATSAALAQLRAVATQGYGWGRFDVQLAGPGPILRVIAWSMNRRSCWTGVATGDQGIFVSRSLLEAADGIPQLPLMEDVALSKRLRRYHRPRCLSGPLLTSARRWQRQGVWRTVLLMWRLRLAYWCGADPRRLHGRYYGHGSED